MIYEVFHEQFAYAMASPFLSASDEGAVVCVGMILSGVRARLVITPVKHSQSVRGRPASVDTAQPDWLWMEEINFLKLF